MMPAMRGGALLSLILTMLVCSGCNAPGAPVGPTVAQVSLADYDAFIDDTLTLMRRYDLQPARVDRSAGRIVTQPTTSAQWFEFWRVDSQGAYQALESSLHTMRRTVTVLVEPRSQNEYELKVEAQKERFNAPTRQVTSASGALAIYSERLPTSEGLRAARATPDYWTPTGRDELLEQFLLNELIDAAARVVPRPADSPPSSPASSPNSQPPPPRANSTTSPAPRTQAQPAPQAPSPSAAPPARPPPGTMGELRRVEPSPPAANGPRPDRPPQ